MPASLQGEPSKPQEAIASFIRVWGAVASGNCFIGVWGWSIPGGVQFCVQESLLVRSGAHIGCREWHPGGLNVKQVSY